MNTEQEKFDAWLVSLSRPTDKYVMSLWWGSAATMPTYRDSWTEAQWKGWKARAKLEKPNPWKGAIDEALVVSCLDCIGDDETPKQALDRLIEWEIEIALDPAVSSRAADLVQPEQQTPVAWMVEEKSIKHHTHRSLHMHQVIPPKGFTTTPLYAHPPAQHVPAGYLYQHDETGRTTFRDELDPNMGPRWYAIPLYAQPVK